MVPSATLAQLGFTSSGQPQTRGRPGCDWADTDSGSSVSLQFVTDARNGLSTIYLNRSNPTLFKPFTIDGFPALIYKQPSYQKGDCSVAVGATDKLYYQADTVSLSSGSDPCTVAERLATTALATMKSSE